MAIRSLVVVLLLSSTVQAVADSVYTVGHSLLAGRTVQMLHFIAEDAGKTSSWTVQSIPGASLTYNWNNCTTEQFQDDCATVDIPISAPDHLIVTARVPLNNAYNGPTATGNDLSSVYEYAARYQDLLGDNNASGQSWLLETWHCTNSGTVTDCASDQYDANGTWTQRLTQDLPTWELIVSNANSIKTSGLDMKLIPLGQAMQAFYNEVLASNVPGYSSLSDLYSDDIHLTEQMDYFQACVMFAAIYNESPVGLDHATEDQYGSAYTAPTAAQAAKMQEVAWNTVQSYYGAAVGSVRFGGSLRFGGGSLKFGS